MNPQVDKPDSTCHTPVSARLKPHSQEFPINEFDLPLVLWCAFALACGGLLKGALGVGTPLLPVPLMALALPPQTAIVLMAMPVVAANVWQTLRAPRADRLTGRFLPAFAALLAGMYLGVGILTRIDEKALMAVVGAAAIVFALAHGLGWRLRIPAAWEKPAGLGFGFAAGVIGGVCSFFGPMLIIYLISLTDLRKEQFIGAIGFLYAGAVIPWAILLYYHGIMDNQLLLYSTAAVLPVALGMAAGTALRRFVSEHRFRRLILAVLVCSGGVILARAWG